MEIMSSDAAVVLIPAYKPESVLIRLVEELSASSAVAAVIVVDDGSGPAYAGIFRSLANGKKVRLLAHVVNLGKGAALKTGLNYTACAFPESVGVVTADADGQHAPGDILAVAGALAARPRDMVVGVRAFDTQAPFRSRFGNNLTRHIMRAVTGQKLTDTQSGLRGIPLEFIPDLLRLPTTGYDFELDMLVTCRNLDRPVHEVPIATIYIDNNRSSHFNPLLDSMRIYLVFLRFSAVSLATAGLDNGIFILGMQFWPHLAACLTVSRLVAGTFQFTASRRGVFHSRAPVASALPKYCLLLVISGTVSCLLIESAVHYANTRVVPTKLMVESMLFAISFVLQREIVFTPAAAANSNATAPTQPSLPILTPTRGDREMIGQVSAK
jgi:glycosyltransferase involved in cell wall biosynthesis